MNTPTDTSGHPSDDQAFQPNPTTNYPTQQSTYQQPNNSQQSQTVNQPNSNSSSQPIEPKKQPDNRPLIGALSSIGLLLLAPFIAIILMLFVFQSYRVDGPSMEQTLHHDDRLIVWKLPRTWARISRHQYVPKRGDIIILKGTGLNNFGDNENEKQLVKRVIGLPGDRIVINDGTITIFNKSHPNGFNPDTSVGYGSEGTVSQYTESSNQSTFNLERNELFVVGDNRSNSLDSRRFGPIKTNQVVGKLVARTLPLSKAKRF